LCRRRYNKETKVRLPKGTDMNRNNFTELFQAVRDETLGQIDSTTNLDDAYDTFLDLTKQIKETEDACEYMERMSEMDEQERLHWRMCLADEGIEMTPLQVDEYIILLELAIAYSSDMES
jgi:hypothetical protein